MANLQRKKSKLTASKHEKFQALHKRYPLVQYLANDEIAHVKIVAIMDEVQHSLDPPNDDPILDQRGARKLGFLFIFQSLIK